VTLLLRRLLGLLGLIGKPIDTGGGGGGGGGGSGGSGGGGITVETDGKIPKVLPQAVVEAVAKCACCPGGSGSGSGSGIRVPCGDAGCACCPGVVWWASQWHRSWSATTPRYATGVGAPTAIMTDYSMSLVGGLDDYYYLGETIGDPSACNIGGLIPVDDVCVAGVPIHILTGTIEWNGTDSYQIDYYADVKVIWECGVPSVEVVFNGLYVNGVVWVFGSDPFFDNLPITADFAIAQNTNISTAVDTSTCGFTAQVDHLPDITVIPLT
jgi:hypothetical protein